MKCLHFAKISILKQNLKAKGRKEKRNGGWKEEKGEEGCGREEGGDVGREGGREGEKKSHTV